MAHWSDLPHAAVQASWSRRAEWNQRNLGKRQRPPVRQPGPLPTPVYVVCGVEGAASSSVQERTEDTNGLRMDGSAYGSVGNSDTGEEGNALATDIGLLHMACGGDGIKTSPPLANERE